MEAFSPFIPLDAKKFSNTGYGYARLQLQIILMQQSEVRFIGMAAK